MSSDSSETTVTSSESSSVPMEKAFSMSQLAEERLARLLEIYPKRKSAIMPALHLAQQEHGWLRPESIRWVAEKVGVSYSHVIQVATFYTMYYKKPVGKYHIQVCRTLSCMICGARKLTSYIKDRLEIAPGEITNDGMWSYEEVECLGSCGSAPMVEINDVYFENLTAESLGSLMDRIQKEQPDLRYSDSKLCLGAGLSDLTRSQVWKTA